MRSLRLLSHQVKAQNRFFWRVPVGAFFTLMLPVIMLVLFVALFGNDLGDTGGPEDTSAAQFYTPALAVFAVGSATYTNIAINVSTRREEGILRRVRGTPLPPWIYIAGVILSAVWYARRARAHPQVGRAWAVPNRLVGVGWDGRPVTAPQVRTALAP